MNKKYRIIILITLLTSGAVTYFVFTKNSSDPVHIPFITNNDSEKSSANTEDSKPKKLFQNYGAAPEFTGITKWLNGDEVKMAGLRGKAVLVFFWTYSDIYSVNTIPYLAKWEETYKDQGLVIVGAHTPEFAFEKVTGNLENAIKTQKINFSIAQDNDYKTWTAYKNQFWPASYLIDKDGVIVYTHFGEGDYETTEKALRTVLGLEGQYTTPTQNEFQATASPELHLGIARMNGFGNTEKPTTDEQIYSFPKKLDGNKFALEGSWKFNQEGVVHSKRFGRIKLNFEAAKVYLVAQSKIPTTIRVFVDGTLIKGVVVSDSGLYELYDSMVPGQHTMEIEVPDEGFEATTFTFK